MMKSTPERFGAAFVSILLAALPGCSVLRAAPAPTTPFLVHGAELHPWYEHAPWDAVWSSNPGHIMVRRTEPREVYVAPINTTYLNKVLNENGQWVAQSTIDTEDVDAMTELLRSSFRDAISKHPETNLRLEDAIGPDTMTLEIALVELTPTKVAVNAAADVGGLIIPGSTLVADAAKVGAQATTALAAGAIAIEMRLIDGKTGAVLAEIKDRQTDPVSIIPNYRDFEEYGWSRETVSDWSHQFVRVFSTEAGEAVDPATGLSILPW